MISDHSGYPLPSYATTIWLDGKGNLCLAVPSGPDSKAHTLTIPLAKCGLERTQGGAIAASSLGWQALLSILAQRAAAANRPIRLGDRAAPVQYDLDEMLGAMRSAPKAKRFSADGVRTLDYEDLFQEQEPE